MLVVRDGVAWHVFLIESSFVLNVGQLFQVVADQMHANVVVNTVRLVFGSTLVEVQEFFSL